MILKREGQMTDTITNAVATEANAAWTRPEDPIVAELITVLKPHPRGLRRWSVMRALRENRRRRSQDVSPKFEIEVERIFRRYSAKPHTTFCRPADTAGEVWALGPESTATCPT